MGGSRTPPPSPRTYATDLIGWADNIKISPKYISSCTTRKTQYKRYLQTPLLIIFLLSLFHMKKQRRIMQKMEPLPFL